MMNEWMNAASLAALLAGAVLGLMFYGGLWWTVRRGLSARLPALWFVISLLLRMGLTLLGFYLVAGQSWQRMVLCLLGFSAARLVVQRRVGTMERDSHAP